MPQRGTWAGRTWHLPLPWLRAAPPHRDWHTEAVQNLRWMNPLHPQTLSIAVSLGYLGAVFGVLGGAFLNPIGLLILVGGLAATIGVANDKKVAWYVAVALASIIMLFVVYALLTSRLAVLFNLDFLIQIVFPVAYFSLLVHPMSRSYVKTWFQ